ncbi:MAG: nucleoside phosphorylase [Candidatus Thorarchaeota archaeon]
MTSEIREYHIDIAPGEIPPLILLPGDPDRARLIAENFFENSEEIAHKREYWSFKGTYKGVPVAVCSTGIGCPSAAIALEELIRVGGHTFVRVGTAGAIDNSLKAGDVIIFSGSVRDDGTSRQYVPLEFPAISDPSLLRSLIAAAEKSDASYRVGIGHSKDAFYSEFPNLVADRHRMEAKWDSYRRAGVLATEMESAALFVIGQLRRVRVGTACVIVGEPIEKEAKIIDKPKLDDLVTIALDAMISLNE